MKMKVPVATNLVIHNKLKCPQTYVFERKKRDGTFRLDCVSALTFAWTVSLYSCFRLDCFFTLTFAWTVSLYSSFHLDCFFTLTFACGLYLYSNIRVYCVSLL
jgi:hypothetical protein